MLLKFSGGKIGPNDVARLLRENKVSHTPFSCYSGYYWFIVDCGWTPVITILLLSGVEVAASRQSAN